MSVLSQAQSAIGPLFASLTSDDSGAASPHLINESCFDFLQMEMVHLLAANADASEKERDAAFFKLEMLGYRVGLGLAERFTKDRPRFLDTLDMVKFICKDLWMIMFKKQVDNLKTNHRGVYVLQDNNFRWFNRMSTEAGTSDAARKAAPYIWFPCGLIRGVLGSFGVVCAVHAETSNLPQCTFQIKIAKI
ncbi:uncharacterized protein VTP21DRAFT_3344 [Calcarisporiella thermophila]|uniref:uncharacterized protein n=1 Tax=Calcarisporiella thermophila TaxID=911321 RepID=UPI0037437E22